VHVQKDSRAILHKVADCLLDDEDIPLEHYVHIARIWERVQRWTRDKNQLSLEPEQQEAFEKLSRLITIGASEPSLVDGMLSETFEDISNIEVSKRWGIFATLAIARLLRTKKDLPVTLPMEPKSVAGCSKYVEDIGSLLVSLYEELGIAIKAKAGLENCKRFLKDVGLPRDPLNEKRSASAKSSSLPKVILERYERADNRIIEVRHVEGSAIVKINSRHASMTTDHPGIAFASSDFAWRCIGRACLDHLGKLDEIQEFLDSFGQHMVSEARLEKRRIESA
jgi:hypothetical protein